MTLTHTKVATFADQPGVEINKGEWNAEHNSGSATNGQLLAADGLGGFKFIAPPAGTGDVVGPASATDNAIARFDATTGKLIQNSAVTISDTGSLVLPAQSAASTAYAAGQFFYDSDDQDLAFDCNDSNVRLNIGQEEWVMVINNTGSTIANGVPVYINGASAGRPTIALAQSNASATTIGAGLTTQSIANGATGRVTCLGLVRGIDTSAFTAGATVFISSTVAGGLTATAPSAPNYRYRIGIVGTSSATVGTIHVTPSTAALGNGTANQIFGMNAAGTAQEVKSVSSTISNLVVNAANSITVERAALTGDITATQNSNTTTLATVNANVGAFTNANITVNAKGQITAAANGSVASSAFSAITSGTNTAAAMVVGSGASLATTGTGTIVATTITSRTIGGVAYDGSANIVPQTIQTVNDAADTSCFLMFGNASGTVSQQPKTNTGLLYDATTNNVTATTFTGALSGNSTTATTATNATNVAITNDTATATACFPTWVTANTGNLPLKVTSTKLSFVPSTGATTITSASSAALTIGLAGAANPALQVDASTASSATGVAIKSFAAGATATITALSTGTDEGLVVTAKGTANTDLGNGTGGIRSMGAFTVVNGGTVATINQFQSTYTITSRSTLTPFVYTVPAGGAGAVAVPMVDYSFAGGTTHTGGSAIALNYDIFLNTSTRSFGSAGTHTDMAGIYLPGPLIAGNFNTTTNSSGLLIDTRSVVSGSGVVTNGYGATIKAPTGATNNFAAQMVGDLQMNGNNIVNAKYQGAVLASAFNATSNTTPTNVTGFSVNVVASGQYTFFVMLDTTSNIAGGCKVNMGGTATMTAYRGVSVAYSATGVAKASNATFGSSDYAATAITANTITVFGGFVVNAAGTVTVQFAQNVSNGAASTILADSTFNVTRVA